MKTQDILMYFILIIRSHNLPFKVIYEVLDALCMKFLLKSQFEMNAHLE